MELARFPSRGGFSLRSIFTFALAALLTVLIGVLFSSHPVHAADATWDGASLRYGGNQYISMGNATANNSLGIPDASPYYAYIASQTQSTSGAAPATQKAYVIYFAPGTSPPSEASASYAEYDYTASNQTFANPTNQQTVTVTPAPAGSGSSCAIEGIGWLACPAMTWLAEGMDNIFTIIAGFMEVQPLQTGNTNGSLYTAWNTMRGIANVAFIIVFIIIIYAQLTNIQLSKYGLKKLLPRLIIAAIAINISYIAAAVAVDVSNILGYSIQDLFMSMQRALVDSGTVDPAAQASLNSIQSWSGFTAFAISGGAAAVVGVSSAIAATGGMLTAAAYILLPILLGLLLALILVLLILAARQAIIIILVIIAPLAIVAYLLPNTEKWFEKWRGLFMTMLIFFPAFAVVFGGAQLAGAVIIKNADSVTMQLLGMVVQVAPLVITPLLLKLSGNVLGNIARIINNPNKGLVDRTRNWSKDRADWHRQRGIGGLDRNGNPMQLTRRNFLRNSARHMDQRKKRLADRTANATTATQTAYENSHMYTARPNRRGVVRYDMAQQKARFEDEKAATHSHHEAHVNDARRVQGSLVYQSGINAQAAKDHATTSQNYTDAFYNNARRDHRIAAGALHASGYRVEMSKDRLTTTENLKVAYYNEQRSIAGTELNALARPLETSKLRVEIAQNTYSTAVEEWKATPGTGINLAAQRAQSSKEHLEGAQAQLQAFFDAQRATPGSILNVSTLNLENSKSTAEQAKVNLDSYITTERTSGVLRPTTVITEAAKTTLEGAQSRLQEMLDVERATVGSDLNLATLGTENSKSAAESAKADLATYLDRQRSDVNGELHRSTMVAEQAKSAQQEAAAELSRIIEEYKSGEIDLDTVPAADRPFYEAIRDQMQRTTARLSAQQQGTTSAKYVQQEYYSGLMDETLAGDPFADEVVRIAAGVDPNGEVRARANAISQLDKLEKEALSNNVILLGDRAERSGTTLKALAKEIYQRQVGEFTDEHGVLQPATEQPLLEAALEALAQDGDISTLRKARMSLPNEHQGMLTRLFARNSTNMKVKGGFDLQANPGLAGASQEKMDASIANTLGDVTAASISGQKAGWWEEVGNDIERIYNNADTYVYDAADPDANEAARQKSMKALRATYQNVTMALTNVNVLKDIGDRLEPTINIHQFLHSKFNDPHMAVDYDAARRGEVPTRNRRTS